MTFLPMYSLFLCGLPGGADSHRLATHSNQASPTAGGPRQSLTSEIRLTMYSLPVSQQQACQLTLRMSHGGFAVLWLLCGAVR